MGYQIIVQEDGRLAVFDGVTDKWAVWDATDEEAAGWLAEQAAAEARVRALHDIAAVRAGDAARVYGRRGVMTFAEANAQSQFSGGQVLRGPVAVELLAELERPLEDADAG